MLDDIAVQKIIELLEKAKLADVTSIDDFGYPVTKTMGITNSKGVNGLWFASSRNRNKIGRIAKNPKINVHVRMGGQQVSLVGDATIRDDFIARHINWHDSMLDKFPLGASDPDLVLIEFQPHYASYYSEGIETSGRL